MGQIEIEEMSFDEKLAKLRRGIEIPSPQQYAEMQEIDALIEKIERIKRRLALCEQ